MKQLLYAFFALVITGSAAFSATDQELYDPKPPVNASYIRFINPTENAVALSGGGISGKSVDAFDISPYYIINEGKQNIAYGSNSATFDITAMRYYTVILAQADDPVVMEDTMVKDPAKAGIYFYNASSISPVKLVADAHGIAIFDNVASNAGVSRDINPLSLELTIKQPDDTPLAALDPVLLQRRSGQTIVIFNADDGVNTLQKENNVDR